MFKKIDANEVHKIVSGNCSGCRALDAKKNKANGK